MTSHVASTPSLDRRPDRTRPTKRHGGRLRRWGVAAVVVAALTAAVAPAAHGDESFAPNPRPHSVVIDWIEAMLLAIEQKPPAPTATTWRMWVVASSMYDAWSAYDATALPTEGDARLKRQARRQPPGSSETALSYAAHRALVFVFPGQKALFDAVLARAGLPRTLTLDPRTPAGLGNLAARTVLDARLSDGSNASAGFTQIASATYPGLYAPANSADPSAPNSLGGDEYDPNRWTPLRVPNGVAVDDDGNPVVEHDDPTTFTDQVFLTPHWGAVRPFALTSGDQFRPPPPPLLGSHIPYTDTVGALTTNDAAFRQQAEEILATSAALTDEHKVIAEFWADGPHTWTPPGHWVQLAIGVSLRDHHTATEDVGMFMALTGALLDAGIAAWDAKRTYDFVRPASAIRFLYAGTPVHAWGGPNKGRQLIDGSEWRPYQSGTFVTPPFAEYVSGHSTFSSAAAEVLTRLTGSNRMYDGATRLGRDYDGDGLEDLLGRHVAVPGTLDFEDGPAAPVVLTWATFQDAADQAGLSRRYGGIHFRDGDLRGRDVGHRIGHQAHGRARFHTDPFGVVRSTIADLSDRGQITARAPRALTVLVDNAERAFDRHREPAGCTLLRVLLSALRNGQAAAGRTGHAQLAVQVVRIENSLCR